MVNNELIKSCFSGLIGFKNSHDPEYPRLYDSLTESRSGWYINSIHPLCSIENIYNSAPNFRNFEYQFATWSPFITYKKGDIVNFSNVNYVAIQDGPSEEPSYDIAYWKIWDPFSSWLEEFLELTSVNFVNEFMVQKKIMQGSRSFVDSLVLYQGNGSLSERIIKEQRFVGVQINVNKQEGLVVRIDSIGLQIDTPQENLDLYLYHSSKETPIKILPINIENAGSFSWINVDSLILDNSLVNSDGVFYLGYYEDDLAGQALRRKMDFSRPCMGCGSTNINLFNQWSKYVKVKAFSVRGSDLDEDKNVFAFDAPEFESESNFGINLKISAYCDLSSLICRNINILAEAFAQKVALCFIEMIAFNNRLNVISDTTKQLAMSELNDNEGSSSFLMKYKKSLNSLTMDFEGTSSVCLPCVSSKSVNIKKSAI